MPIEIQFEAEGREPFWLPVEDDAVIAIHEAIQQGGLDDGSAFFGNAEGQAIAWKAEDLLAWLGELKSAVRKAKVKRWTYKVGFRFVPDSPESEMMWGPLLGGIRIDGELFRINCYDGQCDLQKMEIDSEGSGVVVGTEDISHLKELATDNMGVLQFKRARQKVPVLHVIDQMIAWLEPLPAEAIIQVRAHG